MRRSLDDALGVQWLEVSGVTMVRAGRHRLAVVLLGMVAFAPCRLSVADPVEPATQTQPWRIGVGGACPTGYMALLARHGMPRERLLDAQLSDASVLRKYDIVIVTDLRSTAALARPSVLLDYVRDGGIAIVERGHMASQQIGIRGKRLYVRSARSLVFHDADHPMARRLAVLGVVRPYFSSGVAIVPEDEPEVMVIAELRGGQVRPYPTTSGSGSYTRGDAPALLLKPLGKGQLVYISMRLSFSLLLRGPEPEELILPLIESLSNGQLVPRFAAARPGALMTQGPTAGTQPEAIAPLAPPGEQEPLAGHWETLHPDPLAAEFDLAGTIPRRADAQVVFDYWNARWYRSLRFANAAVAFLEVQDGKERTLRRADLPRDLAEADLLINRRSGSVTVRAGDRLLLTAADGPPWKGMIGCRGVGAPELQLVVPPYLTDDFTRAEGHAGGWEAAAETWKVESTPGKPRTGANPFSYQFASAESAMATAGYWFWDNYAFSAAAKWTGEAAGLCFHYNDPKSHLLLRIEPDEAPGDGGTAALVRVRNGRPTTLAQQAVSCAPEQWYRLGVRVSGGWILGLLDGRVVVEAEDAARGQGAVGLYAEGSKGHFDDVEAKPWRAIVQVPGRSLLDDLETISGQWGTTDDDALRGRGKGKSAARAISGSRDWDRAVCSAEVRPGGAQAGLVLQYQDEDNHCLVLLSRGRGRDVVQLVRVTDGERKVVAEQTHSGGKGPWRSVRAELRGRRITVAIGDDVVIDTVDLRARVGGVGLCVTGPKAATFRKFRAVSLDDEMHIADPPTPTYTGIIDKNTWASTACAWLPQPDALGRFWHHAPFPGDVRLRVGVHRDEAETVSVRTILGDGRDPLAGYSLVASHTWGAGRVDVVLYREGQSVATGEATIPDADQAFVLAIERLGSCIIGAVNDRPLIAYTDDRPLPDDHRLGIEATGLRLWPDGISIESPDVRTYLFADAPADWVIDSGNWGINTRWPCGLQWSWFAGWDEQMACITNKRRFIGDLYLDVHVGPTTMQAAVPPRSGRAGRPAILPQLLPPGHSRREDLSDVFIRICGQQGDPEAGYTFKVAGMDSPQTVLKRNGDVVAHAPGFAMPHYMHYDWIGLTVEKSGDRIAVHCCGQPVIEYTDPDPLPGGHVSLGTFHNAMLIPRVTVYGRCDSGPPTASGRSG